MSNRKGIAMKCYRLERWFYEHHLTIFAKIVYRSMQIVLGCTIPYTCVIGKDADIAHFHGVIISHICTIGDGTVIYQHVTIGGLDGQHGATIGKNCRISPGAVLLGEVKIGDNVKIGPNSVVLHDIPDNCIAMGVPAKIIQRGE